MNADSAKDISAAGRPLVIAGTASGVGKTTVAIGIMGALRRRGLDVAPFKVGPDYIDPGFHRAVTGRESRNLDTWMTGREGMLANYRKGSADADVSVVEGVMGLFDGRVGAGNEGSTADIARRVGGAVVLVADCRSMSRSLAPVLAGFAGFDGGIDVAGAILNNVGSDSHAAMLRDAAREAGVPVLGTIPRREGISLGSRHLGLVPAGEGGGEALEAIIEAVGENVDLGRLLELASAGSGGARAPAGGAAAEAPGAPADLGKKARLAVARDQAFDFYYADSLEALADAGAELVFFSPLHDGRLPACDGIYLGGGFPEMFARDLEANTAMRSSVAAAVRDGVPAYAECGGLVYLCRDVDVTGKRYRMSGALPLGARMTGRRQALGYVEAVSRRDSILFEAGQKAAGHEFHWSRVDWDPDRLAYDCHSSRRPGGEADGYCADSLLASYVHINFAGNPGAARRFVNICGRTKGALAGAAR